jgi:hypothetical protein
VMTLTQGAPARRMPLAQLTINGPERATQPNGTRDFPLREGKSWSKL